MTVGSTKARSLEMQAPLLPKPSEQVRSLWNGQAVRVLRSPSVRVPAVGVPAVCCCSTTLNRWRKSGPAGRGASPTVLAVVGTAMSIAAWVPWHHGRALKLLSRS